MPAEEQPGPQRVERKLCQKQGERGSGRAEAALAPDQPGSNSHHRIEHRPHRAEEPGWRCPCGPAELGIEWTCLYRCSAADQGGDETDAEPGREPYDLLLTGKLCHAGLRILLTYRCPGRAASRTPPSPRRIQGPCRIWPGFQWRHRSG